MSIINIEKLTAGIVFADKINDEYIYMPGSEIGSNDPICIFERKGQRSDISIKEAAILIDKLNLKKLNVAPFGKI